MGIKIKNLQTGEFEKFNIPALKGEKGEPGEIESSEKVDYIGKQHSKLRDTMNANVDYIIKTAIGEFNYLGYEGQHITATNSIEGHARSAILSGQTLVNLCKNLGDELSSSVSAITYIGNEISLKNNTTYIFIAKVKSSNRLSSVTKTSFLRIEGMPGFENLGGITGDIETTYTTKSFIFNTGDKTKIKINLRNAYNDWGLTENTSYVKEIMIIEYQEGIENWDIPYFEGMTSCKMPTLHTVGKNLFNVKEATVNWNGANIKSNSDNTITFTPNSDNSAGVNGTFKFVKPIRFKVGTQFTYSFKRVNGGNSDFQGAINARMKVNKKDGSQEVLFIGDLTSSYFDKVISKTYTFTEDFDSIVSIEPIMYSVRNLKTPITIQYQLEEGSAATSYEPYKSNILTTPEEVVLRSLPNGVKDTLNLNTGVYTQRIKTLTLNGSEDWFVLNSTVLRLKVGDGLFDNNSTTYLLCDKMPVTTFNNHVNPSYDGYLYATQDSSISVIQHNRTLDEWKAHLQSNPINVQYGLIEPIIKTVDLSDNVVYSYGSTMYYSCSSEEGSLVPTLSVKVPTDTQLTIQEQKATTQTLLIKNMDLQQSIKEVQAMNLAFNTALYNSFNSIREEVEDIKKHVSTNENLEGSF